MRRVFVAVMLASAVASAGELRARAVERGVEEPGRFGPANLFDGRPETAWCAPAGSYAHVTYAFYDGGADADALTGVGELEVSADDASGGAREVTVRIYATSAAYAEATATVDPASGKSTVRVPLLFLANNAMQIDIHVERKDAKNRSPVCLNEVVLYGLRGPLVVPGLRAAADRAKERDRALAAAKKGDLGAYVTAFTWVYFNPEKKTSTWESARYEIRADGTFTRSVRDLSFKDPIVTTGAWTLRGTTLSLGSLRARLVACGHAPGYLCSADGALVPIPAE